MSFDGTYFVFADPNTGEAVYLDPENPNAPIFVAAIAEQLPQSPQPAQSPPADARRKHILLQNHAVVEAGTGHKTSVVGAIEEITPLQNGCYWVREGNKWKVVVLTWGKSSSIMQHPLTSDTGDKITLSSDKRFLVLTDAFGGVREIFDSQKACPVFSKQSNKAAHLPKFVKNGRIINVQFTPDGGLTYVDVNIQQRTWNLYFYDPQSEASNLLISLPNPGEIQYSVNPFANVAFVHDTANGNMRLIDLVQRREIPTTVPIRYLYADSSGSLVTIVHTDDSMSVFHPKSGDLITGAMIGGRKITLACAEHHIDGSVVHYVKDDQDGYHSINDIGGLSPYIPVSDDQVLFVEYATTMAAIFAKKLTFGHLEWHRALAFSQEDARKFSMPLLDKIQRPGKQLVYKHARFNIIIDETDPAQHVVIDPASGKIFPIKGQVYNCYYGKDGSLQIVDSTSDKKEYSSVDTGQGSLKPEPDENQGVVLHAFDLASGSFIEEYRGEFYFGSQGNDPHPTLPSSIGPGKYSEVSFDGRYYVFADTNTGDLVYLDPQDPGKPIFVPVTSQPQAQQQASASPVPAQAQQRHVLVEDRYVRQVGAGVISDLGPAAGNLQYIAHEYYRVTVGETDNIYKVSGDKIENCFWIQKNKGSMLVSPDKSTIVVTDDNGIIQMIFDCRTGKKYYLCQAGLSELYGTPVEKYHQPQFSQDGKYLTYMAVDEKNPVAIGVGAVYKTSLCVINLEQNMQVTRGFSVEAGRDELEYTLCPFAALAYVRNKTTGFLSLVDLKTGQTRVTAAKFLRTDSTGAYTLGVDTNNKTTIYHTGTSTIIDTNFLGGQDIVSFSVRYYPGKNSIYVIKTADGTDHRFFLDASPMDLAPGQVLESAAYVELIDPEFSRVQFEYSDDSAAMNLTVASLEQLSGREGVYRHPRFPLVIDNRDPARAVAIDPQTGNEFKFHGEIDWVQYGSEENGIKPVILVESHEEKQMFFADTGSAVQVPATFEAGESGGFYITRGPAGDKVAYYISAPKHATVLKQIDAAKYMQVSFDGKYFVFSDPQTGDVVYLDPQDQNNPVFIPASSSASAQADEERVKMLLIWRDQVISQRDSWIAQARAVYQPFLEMIPAEFRPAIERAMEFQIIELYREQDEAIRVRFRAAIDSGAPINLADLPFDAFLQRMERVKQVLPQFLEEQGPKIHQKNFEFRKHFFSSLFDTLFGLCLRHDLVVDNIDAAFLETIACGWKVATQEQLNLVPVIHEFIEEIRNAHPNADPSSTINTIVQFLSMFAGTNSQVNCQIVAQQLSKILKLKPAARNQRLQKMVKAFGEFSETAILFAFAQGKAKDADLQDAWPFAVFLTNEVEQVASRERFMPEGEDKFFAQDPESDGIAISQIMVLEQMRPRQDENDIVMTIDYFLEHISPEHISDLPEISEKAEQDIMRNITVQRESGASTAETAQNSGDATKDMEDGELVISYYVQEGDEKKEFVEEAQDNGTGALQEVALLIPKSTKAAGGQVDLAGFFGTGKYTIFEGVDRLEIITNNGSRAYLFAYQVIPDANGRPSKVRLVQIREIHDARVQRGVTVRRIKSLDNTIPELDQMLSQRAWKTFCGLAQRKNFKIYFLDHEGNKRQLTVGSQKDPNHPEVLCELEFSPGRKGPKDKPMLRIYSTKDMPLQIIDRAGLRVCKIRQEYLTLIPESLRDFIANLGIVIQIPLPLIRDRSAFVHEDEYLEEIRKYVAIAFYQALAFKTLTQTRPQFLFENFPRDWEMNSAYWNSVAPDADLGVLRLAKRINAGRFDEIDNADLERLRTTGKKLDWEKKFVKLILLLKVATDLQKPKKRTSLLLRRKAIQKKIDAERAAKQTRLLEEGGYTEGQTPSLEDVPDAYAKIVMAANIDLAHQQMQHPERYVVEPKTAAHFELIRLAESIARNFGIEQVLLLREDVAFAGAFTIFQDKRTMFLSSAIANEIGQADSQGVQIDKATDTIVHELGHFLEELVSKGNAQGLWNKGHVAHLSNFSHDSVGTFAESMKYAAAVSLAHHQPPQIADAAQGQSAASNTDQGFTGGVTSLDASTFDSLWEYSGREVPTPAEAGRIINERTPEHPEGFFGPDFHLPQIKLISQAEMDTLVPGQSAVRQGEQVLVVDSYWEALSDETTPQSLSEGKDTKLNLLFHEGMAIWCERKGISAEEIPMLIEGLFKDSQGFTRPQDKQRQKAHQGIAVDRAMEGEGYHKEIARLLESGLDNKDQAIGVHGTSVEAIQYLAQHGHMPVAAPDVGREFYFYTATEENFEDAAYEAKDYAQEHAIMRYIIGKFSFQLKGKAYFELTEFLIHPSLQELKQFPHLNKLCRQHGITKEKILQWIQESKALGRQGVIILVSKEIAKDFVVNTMPGDTVGYIVVAEEGLPIKYIVGIEPLGEYEWDNLEGLSSNEEQPIMRTEQGETDQSYEGGIVASTFPGETSLWRLIRLAGVAALQGVGGDVMTIGDIHAELQGLRDMLAGLGIIKKGNDENGLDDEWIAEGVTVVQGGDAIDRGLKPLETLRYLRLMQQKAKAKNSQLVRIIGNHELMYLLRHEHGEWDGAIDFYRFNGAISGMDESLCNNDAELVAALREDIKNGDLLAVYECGGKLFSHGVVSANLIWELSKTHPGVEDPRVFAQSDNQLLQEAAAENKFENIIFCLKLGGIIHRDIDGVTSGYFRNLTDTQIDNLPFDEVVFHDYRYFDSNGSIGVKTGRNTSRSVICGDVAMSAPYVSGRAAVVFRDGLPYASYSLFDSLWQEGEKQAIPVEIIDIFLMDRFFGDTLRMPRIRLISREQMDQLSPAHNALRRSQRILVVKEYWENLSLNGKLNFMMHEAMADWCEMKGVPAGDIAMMNEGLKKDEHGFIDPSDRKRQKAHLGINVDRAMEGAVRAKTPRPDLDLSKRQSLPMRQRLANQLLSHNVRILAAVASFDHGTNFATQILDKLSKMEDQFDNLLEIVGDSDPEAQEYVEQIQNICGRLRYIYEKTLEVIHPEKSDTDLDGRIKRENENIPKWHQMLIDIAEQLNDCNQALREIAQRTEDSDEQRALKDLLKYSEETQAVIEDRLDMIEGEKSDNLVDANEIVTDLRQLIAIPYKLESVLDRIIINPVPGRILVQGNRRSIISMITNLVSNALEYAGEDATVTVSIREEEGRVVITVADNGVGIEPVVLDAMGNPFFTTGGTGIGLTECKILAENHGGWLEVESELGVGTTFTINLPVAEPQESTGLPDLQSPGAGPGTPSAIEHPNNNVAQARELMEQGKLEETEELIVQAIDMFNDLIARNADAPADTLDAEIAQAAQNNLQIAQALLEDIKQRQQTNQAIAVGRGTEGEGQPESKPVMKIGYPYWVKDDLPLGGKIKKSFADFTAEKEYRRNTGAGWALAGWGQVGGDKGITALIEAINSLPFAYTSGVSCSGLISDHQHFSGQDPLHQQFTKDQQYPGTKYSGFIVVTLDRNSADIQEVVKGLQGIPNVSIGVDPHHTGKVNEYLIIIHVPEEIIEAGDPQRYDEFVKSSWERIAEKFAMKQGGIDFRALPIITQPMSIPAAEPNLAPFTRVKLPVDPQWHEVTQMVEKGIVPSYQRIKDYLEESCNTPECQQKVNQVLSCIADILRLEEEEVNPTAPVLHEILILLESGQSAQQLQVALAKIEIPEEEPAEPVEP
ncbi:MAG: ATP-binding protein [Candidatus Omnitrophica bacterium]|nr:ATP-binding protein [Candidatus Omnitrophota bacterium]